jgi:hypothetical protein
MGFTPFFSPNFGGIEKQCVQQHPTTPSLKKGEIPVRFLLSSPYNEMHAIQTDERMGIPCRFGTLLTTFWGRDRGE